MSTQTHKTSEDTTSTDLAKGNLVVELDVARQNLQVFFLMFMCLQKNFNIIF